MEIISTRLKLADSLLKHCSHGLLYKLFFPESQRTPGCPHAWFTCTKVSSWSRSWENALKLPTAMETTYSLNLGTLKGLHLSKKTSLAGVALCPHCVYFLCFRLRSSTRLKTSTADKGQKAGLVTSEHLFPSLLKPWEPLSTCWVVSPFIFIQVIADSLRWQREIMREAHMLQH